MMEWTVGISTSIIGGLVVYAVVWVIVNIDFAGMAMYMRDVIHRVWAGQPYPMYEILGGTIVAQQWSVAHMVEVPAEIARKAKAMAMDMASKGAVPRFDLKITRGRYVYWIHAGMEASAHVMAVYRRPRIKMLSATQ